MDSASFYSALLQNMMTEIRKFFGRFPDNINSQVENSSDVACAGENGNVIYRR